MNGAVPALQSYGRAMGREEDGGGLLEVIEKVECGGDGDSGARGSMMGRLNVSGQKWQG